MINKTKEHLAEARAIHLAMRNEAISYKEAKRLTKPLLEEFNLVVITIAKKYGVKPMKIAFQDLGRNI
jgi:hypothetical protein